MESDSSGRTSGHPSRRLPVFGRWSEDAHPYDEALDECATLGSLFDAAVAQNLRHDHRVSPERERYLKALYPQPRSLRELEQSTKRYFEHRVRKAEDPDYIDEGLNGQNIRVGGIANKRQIKGTVKLGRVLDLNGLLPPLLVAAEATEEELQEEPRLAVFKEAVFDDLNSADKLGEFLDRKLAGPDDETEQFLEDVLLALNFAARKSPFQPSWVTFWTDLETALKDDKEPERWAETVGRRLPTAGRWLIVLQYTIEDAAMLVRPTQLDTDWSSHHFPSPPHPAWDDAESPFGDDPPENADPGGGHPMDLGDADPRSPLAREFIHSPIRYTIDQWALAGRKLRRTTRASSGGLTERRKQHYLRLAAQYPQPLGDWMEYLKPDA